MLKKTVLVLGALCFASPVFAAAPSETPASKPAATSSPAKLEKVRKLLKMTGANQIGRNMLQALQAQLPPTQSEAISKAIKPDEIVELEVAVYARHFSEPEIDRLIQFYGTPLGQRLVQESPGIAQESMQVGQQYAISKLQQLQPKAPPPASKDVPAK